jgi:hypothetical protein
MVDWKEAQETTPVPEPEHWVMHFDGSKLLHGSGAGVTLKSPKGDELSYVLQIHFPTTNNIESIKRYCMGYVSQRRSAYNILCVVATLTLSLSRSLAHTKVGTKSWRHTETKWTRWPKVSSAAI